MGKSVEEFIKHLRVMSGTGNGIGPSAIARLESIAIKQGFIRKKSVKQKEVR